MRFFNLGLVALAGVASSQLPTISIEEPPPGLIDSPAEPPLDKLCSSTLGIIRPCTSFSRSSIPTVTTNVATSLTRNSGLPATTSSATKILTTRTTSIAPTSTGSDDKIKECFLPRGPCENLFHNMTVLWDTLSEDTPFWEDYRPFDLRFCDPKAISAREGVSLPICSQCSSPTVPSAQKWTAFQNVIHRFCTEDEIPTLYMLSTAILDFADLMVEKPFNITPAGLNPRVAELISAWDKKQPSRSHSMKTSTSVQTGNPTSLSPQVVTRGLSQLPHAWPYTRAGVARRPGQTAMFTVTKALEGGVGEFVVVEGVVWNPRPLDSFDVFGNFTQSVVRVGATSSGVSAGETIASSGSSRRSSSIPIPTLSTQSRS